MDILARIVAHKKQRIAAAKRRRPLSAVRRAAEAPRKRRPFAAVLARPGVDGANIIAEIKRASPSKGVIRADLSAAAGAADYAAGGAAALSVLTDQRFFQGSMDDLVQARQSTSLPVLRKDFLISQYQLYQSAAAGADAVLLIVRILSLQQLKDYLSICSALSLDALVEVYSPDDLEIAQTAGAALIGINNRNLRSFDTDLKNAAQIADRLESWQVAVAASGISRRNDIENTLSAGIWNFLIGESLVRSNDPRAQLRRLLGRGKG